MDGKLLLRAGWMDFEVTASQRASREKRAGKKNVK
jgi:hypothetical protein